MEPRLDWYDVIDDFYPVVGTLDAVLIPRGRAGSDLHIGVAAAVAAAIADLRSLDWARDHYVDETEARAAGESVFAFDLLRQSYELSESAITDLRGKLVPAESGATSGEWASSIALERFPATLKSVHVLYRMGHLVDGDVVARGGVEQIAWAFAVSSVESPSELEDVRASASIRTLKELYPGVGRLYGALTRSAHMDVYSHMRMTDELEDGRRAVTIRADTLEWGSKVLLVLGDLWLAVWEATQANHLPSLVSIERDSGGFRLREDRPFLQASNEHLAQVQDFATSQSQ